MQKERIAVVDCDNFFVSCERAQDESLMGKAVCVMGNNDGCVIARSNEAKKLGLPMGYPYFKAKVEFPDVIYLSGNHSLYSQISHKVFALLKNYTPDIEQYSIDEGFFDISKIRTMMGKSDFEIAKTIREDIFNQLKIPVSIGIASTKTLAKMATEIAKKEGGIKIIEDDEREFFLKAQKLEDIWGIGRHSLHKLKDFGVKTAFDFAQVDDFWLQKMLTKRGVDLKYELLGQIRMPVEPKRPLPKSLQSTRTFAQATKEKQFVKTSLLEHLSILCSRLRKYHLKAFGLGVMLKDKHFLVTSQKILLKSGFNSELEVQKEMFKLLDRIFQKNVVYRSCGVWVYNLEPLCAQQIGLFETNENLKYDNISQTLDKIEAKFGKGTIKFGRV